MQGMAQRITARLPSRLEIRVPVLIALVVLLMSWMQKHLQWEVPNILGVTGAALVGCPLLLSVGERLYRKHRALIEDSVVGLAVTYLGVLLQTWALVALFVLALVPNLFFSSVSVLAAGVPGERRLELRAVDEDVEPPSDETRGDAPRLTEERPAHTFKLFTTPFGRSFVLKATGYRPRSFTLYPGLGREFQLADLEPAPAIVIRIAPESYDAVDEAGEVRVFRREDSGALTLLGAQGTRLYYGSYIFGDFKRKVSDLEAGWDEDLQANEDLTSSDVAVAKEKWSSIRWTWRRSIRTDFEADREPLPGDLLEVFFLPQPGALSGRAAFVVTEDEVQDHMLMQLSIDQRKSIKEGQPDLWLAITGPLPVTEDSE